MPHKEPDRRREYLRAYRKANRNKLLEQGQAYREANRDTLAAKQRDYYGTNREACLAQQKAYTEANREVINVKRVAAYAAGVSRWIGSARLRAHRAGLPFDLTSENIHVPEVCPVLGIKLERGRGRPLDGSPSLDRLVPALGYVHGNVRVISNKANRIKNDATLGELKAVVRWLEAELCP